MTVKKPRFVDLFAGCGGLSLGLSKAGWQGVFAIEADRRAFLSFEKNFLDKDSDWKFTWEHDWISNGPNDIIELIGKRRKKLSSLEGSIDLIAGGPPCQGFSVAGRRQANDPRNQLFSYYVKFINLIKPKLLLLENVGGIDRRFANDPSDEVRDTSKISDIIKAKLRKAGYEVHSKLIHSCDFGVPQYRPRYILFGVRKDLADVLGGKSPFDLMLENRCHFLYSRGLGCADGDYITAKDAISDLEIKDARLEDYPGWPDFKRLAKVGKAQSNYQSLMREGFNGKVPNSLRLSNHLPRTRERFESITRKCIEQDRRGIALSDQMRETLGMKKHSLTVLHPDKLSHTLTTLPDDLLHYDENRILTVREMARLQSFPDNFEFHGKYTTGGKKRVRQVPRYSQVGNAVPPLLAEAIGEVLLEVLNLGKSRRTPRRRASAA